MVKESIVKLEVGVHEIDIPTGAIISQYSSVSTAFFVSKQHLMTCYHCIKDSYKIKVYLAGHNAMLARVVKTIPEFDVALLELMFGEVDIRPIEIDYDFVEIGQKISIWGFSNGYEEFSQIDGSESINMTTGIINGKNNMDYRVSAVINSGDSGGPLILNDKCCGLVSYKIVGEQIDNMFYCKNFNSIQRWLRHMFADDHGEGVMNYRVPCIDFTFNPLIKEILTNRPEIGKIDSGILVTHAHKDSLFRKGDILLVCDDDVVLNSGVLKNKNMSINNYISTIPYGHKVCIDLIRHGRRERIEWVSGIPNHRLQTIYHGEKHPIYHYKNVIIGKLTNNIMEYVMRHFQEFSYTVSYLLKEKYSLSTQDIFLILYINDAGHSRSVEYIHSVKPFEIIKKFNGKTIASESDLLSAMESSNRKYFITASHNIYFF